MRKDRQGRLVERRKKLSEILKIEAKELDAELKASEETVEQRLERLTRKAVALKTAREAQRHQIVQEKLYQRWRQSVDELRTADSKLFELETTLANDDQKRAKEVAQARAELEEELLDSLVLERIHLQDELDRKKQNKRVNEIAFVSSTLTAQMAEKHAKEARSKEDIWLERKALQANLEAAETDEHKQRQFMAARIKDEREKMVAFICRASEERNRRLHEERTRDRQWVQNILLEERKLAQKEEEEKLKYIQQIRDFNDALRLELKRQAEADTEIEKLQATEREAQWQKRLAEWQREEDARRRLLEEVYDDRANQVAFKDEERRSKKQQEDEERDRYAAEMQRQLELEENRNLHEKQMKLLHQEELFRQIDFRQIQKARELQQHAIEQREAIIEEERFRRAIDAEKLKQQQVAQEILRRRAAQPANHLGTNRNGSQRPPLVAPWDK
jgi:trichoplein keratin filament-binding protein